MGKRIFVICLVGSSLVGISQAQVARTSVKTFIVGYTPAYSREDTSIYNYGLYVQWPESARLLRKIHEHNQKAIFLRYDNFLYVDTLKNPWWSTIREDPGKYLLKTIRGERQPSLSMREKYVWGYIPPFSDKFSSRFFLDPRSPSWKHLYVKLAQDSLQPISFGEKSGIFMDNVWLGLAWDFAGISRAFQVDLNGDGKMDWRDDDVWTNLIIQFSKAVKEQLGAGKVLIANFGRGWRYGDSGWKILTLGGFDGYMDEGFAHVSLDTSLASYKSESWISDLSSLLLSVQYGKIALMQSLGKETDYHARIFCLSSFLLGAGSTAYYNYRFHTSYDRIYWLPEFDLDLGKPTETFTSLAQAQVHGDPGLYKRSFQKGEVYINISDTTYPIQLAAGDSVMRLSGGTVENGGRLYWSRARVVELKRSEGLIISR